MLNSSLSDSALSHTSLGSFCPWIPVKNWIRLVTMDLFFYQKFSNEICYRAVPGSATGCSCAGLCRGYFMLFLLLFIHIYKLWYFLLYRYQLSVICLTSTSQIVISNKSPYNFPFQRRSLDSCNWNMIYSCRLAGGTLTFWRTWRGGRSIWCRLWRRHLKGRFLAWRGLGHGSLGSSGGTWRRDICFCFCLYCND